MPKQKHTAHQLNVSNVQVLVDLNVSVLTLLTVSTEKLRNNVVIFVKASMVHSGDFKRIKAMLTRLK